jgi:hypothetical protein
MLGSEPVISLGGDKPVLPVEEQVDAPAGQPDAAAVDNPGDMTSRPDKTAYISFFDRKLGSAPARLVVKHEHTVGPAADLAALDDDLEKLDPGVQEILRDVVGER